MSTRQETVDYITDQLASAGHISARKMFGEYALYLDTKVIAFVCDDQLFIKPTEAGRKFIDTPDEAPAYPGSKMYYRIDEGQWENHEWLVKLVRTTADALPLPKPKKPKR